MRADIIGRLMSADVESVKRLYYPKTSAVFIVHIFDRPIVGLIQLIVWLKGKLP